MGLPILFLALWSSSFLLQATASFSLRPHCHNKESSALLQLKSSFVISRHASDPSLAYPKTLTWKPQEDCCSWDGVECDAETGHVIGLDLSSSYLRGSITSNTSLFRLVHLQKLHLADNHFMNSRIPDEIGHLTALLYLNLSRSAFYGQVPEAISKLSNLLSLDFSHNYYSGDPLLQLQKSTFTRVVRNLTRLEKLDLRFVHFPASLPPQLSNLSSLTHLFLDNCSLQGTFPREIFQLPKLEFLSVSDNNNLTGEIPEFVSRSRLTTLVLRYTSFFGSLPTSIGNVDSLTVISARHCKFSGPIPSSLGNLTKLSYLNLGENGFTGSIPSSLANLTQVTSLVFGDNDLSHTTYDWLRNHPKLFRLDLESTNLVGCFPPAVRNLTELTILDLSENQLTASIPSWLGNFTQLQVLDLSSNKLDGLLATSPITKLHNLEILGLGENNFGGELDVKMFSNMTELGALGLGYNNLSLVANTSMTNSKLTSLELPRCNLREFPAFIQSLDALVSLDISGNNIHGAIPDWLWAAHKNIQDLQLFNSALKGTLSPSICNLHSLQVLKLADNDLRGSLPKCLGNFNSDIQVLELRNNSFQGTIPWSFERGNCSLRTIDLSYNQLNGQIPRSLVNCSMLEMLDLSSNQISDTFPSWLGGMAQLQVLALRSNKLNGKIGMPTTKFDFPALRIIDLSHNELVGQLPAQYLQTWRSMKAVQGDLQTYMMIEVITQGNDGQSVMTTGQMSYLIDLGIKGQYIQGVKILKAMVAIDLSSNRFKGPIPESLGGLQALILLNISNNQISGPIPESLENLTNIEAMDLSHNMLSGKIPQQLAALSFLEVFDVSHNHLVGPIPQGTQFDTFSGSSFQENSGLCGRALSKLCSNQTRQQGTGSAAGEEDGEDEDSAIKWVIISLGYASGLVVGVVLGNICFDKNEEWLAWNILGQMTPRRSRRRVKKATGTINGDQRLQLTAQKSVKVHELDQDSLEAQLGSVQTTPRAEEDVTSSSLLQPGTPVQTIWK